MEFIIQEILSALFDGLLHGKKVPKAVKYVLTTLLFGFVIAIFILCAITAAHDNIPFMIFSIIFVAVFIIFYIILLKKIHNNKINDD